MRKSFVAALLFLVTTVAGTCQTYQGGGLYNFPAVTGTGALNSLPISYKAGLYGPSTHTVDWTVTGTAPSACTLELRGSSDGVVWYSLTGVQDCTSSNMVHVLSKSVALIQINVLSYTAGDGTTRVTPHYTRGQ